MCFFTLGEAGIYNEIVRYWRWLSRLIWLWCLLPRGSCLIYDYVCMYVCVYCVCMCVCVCVCTYVCVHVHVCVCLCYEYSFARLPALLMHHWLVILDSTRSSRWSQNLVVILPAPHMCWLWASSVNDVWQLMMIIRYEHMLACIYTHVHVHTHTHTHTHAQVHILKHINVT